MRLLVVEDDPKVGGFLHRGLTAEGFIVEWAHTAKQGLQPGLAAACDLVILDLMLPDMSGLAVCHQLRAQGVKTPILMLTALDDIEHKVAGLRSGADDYLTKPFDVEELLARIAALVRRSRLPNHVPASLLTVADLTLDLDSLIARRGNMEIELTAKELALLELLMRVPGKICSRDEILSAVWGSAEDPLTNIVDVYIRRLRMKIGDDKVSRGLIRTLRGRGYKIESA
jgi:DNA-binding response OmpR family regulator